MESVAVYRGKLKKIFLSACCHLENSFRVQEDFAPLLIVKSILDFTVYPLLNA